MDKKTECARDLRERILAYELPPGVDLDETGISQQYGLSRTPLREIFQKLQAEGFIRIAANRGARTAPLDVAVIRAMFRTAPFVYTAVMQLAVENRTAAQIDQLKASQSDLIQALDNDDARAAALANHGFHAIIGEMAHNPYLEPTHNRLLVDHTRLSREFYDPTGKKEKKVIRKACNQHDKMIEAIETSNAERGVKLVLSHWELARELFDGLLNPDEIAPDLALLEAT